MPVQAGLGLILTRHGKQKSSRWIKYRYFKHFSAWKTRYLHTKINSVFTLDQRQSQTRMQLTKRIKNGDGVFNFKLSHQILLVERSFDPSLSTVLAFSISAYPM